MPTRAYIQKKFQDESLATIAAARQIAESYAAQGYDLTLRQLYYQFVARDLIPNRQSEYKRLGSIVNDARLAGLLDWDYIVDRTRNLRALPQWNSPASVVQAAARGYRTDLWASQHYRPEVWIEKDALVGVIQGVCDRNSVPYFSCRGYTSQSEMWGASQRLGRYLKDGQVPVIIHLGDHDPSGIDMTRDIQHRLQEFMLYDWLYDEMTDSSANDLEIMDHMKQFLDHRGSKLPVDDDEVPVKVVRIALNMDQVDEYDPPPNPAKLTDSRARGYVQEFGYDSWELDALEPPVLAGLIEDQIDNLLLDDLWEEAHDKMEHERDTLLAIERNYSAVAEFAIGLGEEE